MTISKVGLAALLLSLLILQPAFAGESYKEEGIRIGGSEFKDVKGVRVGKATIKTGFSTQGQYDTNVYRTPNNTTKDYIFTLMPKVLLDLPMGLDERHLLQLMYVGEGGLYSHQTKQNYMNNEGAANLNLKLPFGYFNANDDVKDTSDRAGTEFTTLVKRFENRAATTIGVEMNKFTFEGGFSNFVERYMKTQYLDLDYYQNVYNGTVYYQLFSKTKALIDYSYGQIEYWNNRPRSGHFNQVVGGLKGDLTGKTVGIAKTGFQIRDYTSGKGYAGFIGELGTITKFSERTDLTLKYNTTPMESTFSNDNYYIMNSLNAKLEQKLMRNFSFWVRPAISRNIYPQVNSAYDVKRRDWLVSAETWLQYKVKDWGKVGVGYEYQRRSSNISHESYGDNLVSTRVDLFF